MINIQRLDAQGQISEIIQLDATLDATLTHTMTVTDFPVEDGANISDHAQQQPAVVTIRRLVSATPLRLFAFGLRRGRARPRQAFEILVELQNTRELVRIVTDLRTYDNMALTNFSAPRRTDTKNALLFTATFREVRIVSSEIVTLSPDEDVQKTATKKEEGGKITTDPDVPKATEAKASFLFRALQGVGVLE